jgi:uncharacterized protein
MAGELVYLDTSGVIAFLDADDRCHAAAVKAWKSVLGSERSFVMTDWVRLECWSLLQRRLGVEAVADFRSEILPLCAVDFSDASRFERLSEHVLLSRKRALSLVDLSSFECMRRRGLRRAIAFDEHFEEQGFLTPTRRDWLKDCP